MWEWTARARFAPANRHDTIYETLENRRVKLNINRWGQGLDYRYKGNLRGKDAPALSPASITFPGFLPSSSRTYLRLSTPCSSCFGHVAYGASPYAGKRTATSLPAALALSTMLEANWKWPGSAGRVYPPPSLPGSYLGFYYQENGENRKAETVLFREGRRRKPYRDTR